MLDTLVQGLYTALGSTGLHGLFRPLLGGDGAILTFHRVLPDPPAIPYGPSYDLVVPRDAFIGVINYLRGTGYDIVSLDDVAERLAAPRSSGRFACLTFDDGYRDTFEIAYPICSEMGAPFAVYVATDMIEGRMLLWWYGLEAIVEANDAVECPIKGEMRSFRAGTSTEKAATFEALEGAFRLAGEGERAPMIEHLEREYGVSFAAHSDGQAMSWAMIEEMSKSDLVAIGAHTVSHPALSTLPAEDVRAEMDGSRKIIEQHTSRPVRHFAYPFGRRPDADEREFALCRDLGFATATTTRVGLISPRHKAHLHALPRIYVLADDTLRRLRVDLSGVPSALRAAIGQS